MQTTQACEICRCLFSSRCEKPPLESVLLKVINVCIHAFTTGSHRSHAVGECLFSWNSFFTSKILGTPAIGVPMWADYACPTRQSLQLRVLQMSSGSKQAVESSQIQIVVDTNVHCSRC